MEKNEAGSGLRKRLVVPGEVLCVTEEFLPRLGAFVNGDGNVKARVVGEAVYDLKAKEVSVKPVKEIIDIRPGDRVIAEIKDVQEKIAVAEAFVKLPSTPLKYRRTGIVVAKRNDVLENMLSVGDIAILAVRGVYRGLNTFDIYSPGCGVMLAICSVCGGVLDKRDNFLTCGKCGNRERRKTVLKYGNLDILKQLVGEAL
ncbi:MAG: exosome complex RNA-binding protein Csl4 [Candidatus Caldarchaeum sp.]